MKKIICLFLILFFCGCEKKEVILNEEPIESIIEEYTDDNKVTIGIYNNTPLSLNLIKEYETDWVIKKDIGVFVSIYTNEYEIPGYYFQDIWAKYYQNYTNIDNYKIGYYISFTLKDGTFLEKTILSPEDTTYFYPYLNTFVYDDVNQEKDAWYRHIEEDEMTDESILTSLKIQAEILVDEINTPITLTSFTYDSEDDFIDNKYRGNSSYTILIKKNNL